MRAVNVHDIVVVVGTCVLGHWLSDLIREAHALADEAPELAEGEGDDLCPDLGRTDGAPRILLTRLLTRRLMDAVAGGQLPVLAVLDDPVDSVRFARALKALDLVGGLREQTRVAACNHLFFQNGAVSLLLRNFDGLAHDLVATAVEDLRLQVPSDRLQGLLERFGGPLDAPWTVEQALEARAPHYVPLGRLEGHVTAEEASVVRQVLSPLVLSAVRHDIGPVVWVSRVFLSGDRPNEVAPPVAEVTGAARILYYGPYFHLPPGTWKARFIIAFSDEVVGTQFRMMVYCESDVIAKVVFRPSEAGAFEGAFTLRHVAADRHIEMHFMTDEGSIQGHVALGQMIFSRLSH